MSDVILDLGCGRRWTKWIPEVESDPNDYIVYCVDTIFNTSRTAKYDFEQLYSENDNVKLIGANIFDFLQNYKRNDVQTIYSDRTFEHIPYDKLHFLFYLLKEVCRPDAKMIFTVPNFKTVFDDISRYQHKITQGGQITKDLIDFHTEVFNEKYDPHLSIWTPDLAYYYVELENYWKINSIEDNYKIDNRDWYMKITATRNM